VWHGNPNNQKKANAIRKAVSVTLGAAPLSFEDDAYTPLPEIGTLH
jgi:hypothetical protein